MPRNYPRIELHPSEASRRKLEALRMEMTVKLGRNVSMNELVCSIVDDFLSKTPVTGGSPGP